METLQLKVQKVIQPIGEFYITNIDHKQLYSMAKADIMRISQNEDSIYDGIQRDLNLKKIRKIEDYVLSKDATFPNSIILNLNKDSMISLEDNNLTIKVKDDTFSILDGQHRLEGLKYFDQEFYLSCSIFIDLDPHQQSRIFVTINSEQTKVNPSVSVYQEYKDKLFTPRKFAAEIAVTFATDKKSKWYQNIKLRGVKDEISEQGIISLKAFYEPILDLIYDDEYYYELCNILEENDNNTNRINENIDYIIKNNEYDKHILWDLYIRNDKALLYKILTNYFEAISEVLNEDWADERSMIKKTTGYNALMMLFKDLYIQGLSLKKLNKDYFLSNIEKLKPLNGKINSKNFESSGLHSAKTLYRKFKALIFTEE